MENDRVQSIDGGMSQIRREGEHNVCRYFPAEGILFDYGTFLIEHFEGHVNALKYTWGNIALKHNCLLKLSSRPVLFTCYMRSCNRYSKLIVYFKVLFNPGLN